MRISQTKRDVPGSGWIRRSEPSFSFIINNFWIIQAIFVGLIIFLSTAAYGLPWILAAPILSGAYCVAETIFSKKRKLFGFNYDSDKVALWRAIILTVMIFGFLLVLYKANPGSRNSTGTDTLWLLFLLPTIVLSQHRPMQVLGQPLAVSCVLLGLLSWLSSPEHNQDFFIDLVIKVFWLLLLTSMVALLIRYISEWYRTLRLVRDIGEELINIRTIEASNSFLQSAVNSLAVGYRFPHVNIFQVSGGHLTCVATSDPHDESLTNGGITLDLEKGIIGYVAREGKYHLANDVDVDGLYLPHPAFPKTRSELAVPINVGGYVFGVLDIQTPWLNAFFKCDIDAVDTLGRHLGLMLDNLQIYETSKRVAQIAESIALKFLSQTELGETLKEICTAAIQEFNADYVVIFKRDPISRNVVAVAQKGKLLRREYDYSLTSHIAGGFVDRLCNSSDDYFQEDLLSGEPEASLGSDSMFAADEEIVSRAIVRLRTSDQTIGLMIINFRTKRCFDEIEQKKFFLFAHLTALSLEKANRFLEAVQVEREEIARDLHDRIMATANGAFRILDTLVRKKGINSSMHEDLSNARAAMSDMQADLQYLKGTLKSIPSGDLNTEIQKVKKLTETAYGVAFYVGQVNCGYVSPNMIYQIRSILNEAIMNAIFHGRARTLELTTSTKEGKLSITFEDDGRGFDPRMITPQGLENIRLRVEKLSGDCNIQSALGEGTRIEMALPI